MSLKQKLNEGFNGTILNFQEINERTYCGGLRCTNFKSGKKKIKVYGLEIYAE